ncbi:hypothetical protein SDC9_04703 [bioreactor metagenome]|uniref:Uncharacterized protein n=1 Tax=bioreactor metagenome TaxID=1076179 RepID=A0A644SX21_9ZZZZ
MGPRLVKATHLTGMELCLAKGAAVPKTDPDSLRQGLTTLRAHMGILYPQRSVFQAWTLPLPIR